MSSRFACRLRWEEPSRSEASLGIAMSTNLHEGVEDLFRDADTALSIEFARALFNENTLHLFFFKLGCGTSL